MAEPDEQQVSPREFHAHIEEVRRAVDLAREASGAPIAVRDYIDIGDERVREHLGQLQHQLDRRIDTQLRERNDTERHLQQQVEATREHATEKVSTLAAKLTAQLDESRRALEMAERERERSARALASGLDRAIEEGDARLREHIRDQISQVQAALASGNLLENERFERAKAEVESLRREMRLIQDGHKEAVQKAENAQKEVNVRGNDFRSQLADQAANLMPRKEVETMVGEIRKRVDEMLPRETFETSTASIETRLTANTSRLDRTSGVGEGTDDARGRSQFATSTLIAVAVAGVSVIGLIVAIANTLPG